MIKKRLLNWYKGNILNWTCRGKEIKDHEDFTSDVIGFIYLLTYDDGSKYIGKKLIRSERRLKPTKAQLAVRKNYVRKEVKNLPFSRYEGSVKNLPDGVKLVSKEIIELCSDKINLTYAEMKHQVMCNVLTDDKYLNSNILGKFYSGKITSDVIYKDK